MIYMIYSVLLLSSSGPGVWASCEWRRRWRCLRLEQGRTVLIPFKDKKVQALPVRLGLFKNVNVSFDKVNQFCNIVTLRPRSESDNSEC